MSYPNRLKKDVEPKPLSLEEVFSLLNSLQSEVSLKLACNIDATKIQSLQLALTSPRLASLAYDRFMQEPYRVGYRISQLLGDGSNVSEWENREISHLINVTLPHDFALCISIIPSHTTARGSFDTIKTCCFPRNCFEKLHVVRDLVKLLVDNSSGWPKPNNTIVLTLRGTFALFKKLNIEAYKIEGLISQEVCHAPPTLNQAVFNQLVTAAILSKGNEKPSSTFVGQVILNT
ncbi:hypothetical protein O181_028466 [Austropuccinia psidii MF-1]|uniref:Uncharacterized protein n=1 Tax=Austropuccinia psidii MF-1 TaxID=1389203 RepID=A0A9Q3CUK1_9BASI|nr:hypothetical protein [Austropuccinia psidii MF-1]